MTWFTQMVGSVEQYLLAAFLFGLVTMFIIEPIAWLYKRRRNRR